MNPSHLAKLGALALGFACGLSAQEAPASPAPAPTPAPAPVKPAEASKDPKDLDANKVKVEFDEKLRQIVAFFPNESQARLRIYAVNRFDAEIAKPRPYFIAEMTGRSVIDALKLDADDAGSIAEIVKILERFEAEAKKSDKLKKSMETKKAAVEAELSRAETQLVDLQSNQSASDAEVASAKKAIESLKADIALADDLSKLEKISGVMGKAKINLDRPSYDFTASFEPAKSLYTLNAGYSFQVDSRQVPFYLDLLKHVQEYKQQLLDHEKNTIRLRDAVEGLFKEEIKN